MGLRSPLSVVVSSLNGAQVLDVTDLEFTSSARGGFMAASFTFPAWVNSDLAGFDPLSRVKVHDARTTRCLFEGYLDFPGRAIAKTGHTWQVGAVGAASVLSDTSKSYIVMDSSMDSWHRGPNWSPGASTELGTKPDDATLDAWLLQFPDGMHIGTGTRVDIAYTRLKDTGQLLGGIYYVNDCGIIDANYSTNIITIPSATTAYTRTATTTVAGILVVSAGDEFPTTDNDARVAFIHTAGGAVTITGDTTWNSASTLWVRSQRTQKDGTVLTGLNTYTNAYALPHWVVFDALWFFCDDVFDIPNSDIDVTWTYQIDQMAYPDGVRFADILSDLALFEPDMGWMVGPSNAAGKHSFTLFRWPTDIRYEIDSRDGWTAPGGEATLANRLVVYWTNAVGDKKSATYSKVIPELDQWGRVRNAEPVTLGDEIGSAAAAAQIGAVLLDQMADSPHAGTLTVARPIRDRLLAKMVMPWEIQPGCLVNVTDVDGPPMQLTEVSYSDSAQAATLTLGDPVYSPEELGSRFSTRRVRPRQ